MQVQTNDWKEVANSYFDKCAAMVVLFVMFTIIVFPNVERQVFIADERIQAAIEILPEIQERIQPPTEIARPIVNIEIIDDIGDDMDDDIEIITTIEITRLDPFIPIASPQTHGQTPRFVVFEDAPVILHRVAPVYPESLRRAGMQGTVILDIEILSDGSIGAIEVFRSLMSGPGGFDEAALEAARQWQFKPAQSAGRPVGSWFRVPFVFSL